MVATDGSIIAPGEFLPAAERFGLIDEIDRWVIRQAAEIAARGFPVNFNLSGASLGQRDLIRTIERLLAESQHVVAAIVNLAKGFNKHTIAEGVEEAETLDLLATYNVDYAQGFAIGRPHPITDILNA